MAIGLLLVFYLASVYVDKFGIPVEADNREKKDAGKDVEMEEVGVITTSMGEIVFRFYPEAAPITVDTFKKLLDTKYLQGGQFYRY